MSVQDIATDSRLGKRLSRSADFSRLSVSASKIGGRARAAVQSRLKSALRCW
jgi:hypothetical protein